MRSSLLLGVAVCAIIASLVMLIQGMYRNPQLIKYEDHVEYWAAGRLILQGDNPYNPDQLLALQSDAGRGLDFAIMMWNPPWTLPWAMPLGLFSARAAQIVWLLFGLFLLILSTLMMWRTLDGPEQRLPLALFLMVLFPPGLIALRMGQISPLMLFGAVGFLYFWKRGYPLLAGACLILLAIKPHLNLLIWPIGLVWILQDLRQRWKVAAGALLALVILVAIPLSLNPRVIHQYVDELSNRPPSTWVTPTLGAALRLWLDVGEKEGFRLQFVPLVLSLLAVIWFVWSRRNESLDWIREMPLLLTIGLATAVYGAWSYDMTQTFPVVLQGTVLCCRHPSAGRRTMAGLLLGTFVIGFVTINLTAVSYVWFVVLYPVLVFGALWVRAEERRLACPTPSSLPLRV